MQRRVPPHLIGLAERRGELPGGGGVLLDPRSAGDDDDAKRVFDAAEVSLIVAGS